MAKRRSKVVIVKCGECSYKYQATVIPGKLQKTFCPKCFASNDAFKKVNLNTGIKVTTAPAVERKLGEIWKEGRKWYIQNHEGPYQTKTKKAAVEIQKGLK